MASVRFTVQSADISGDVALDPGSSGAALVSYGAISSDGAAAAAPEGATLRPDDRQRSSAGNSRYNNLADIERDAEPYQVADCNLALFETEITSRPKISTLLSRLANSEYVPNEEGKEPETALQKSQLADQSNKMGTLMGVYLPCLQNILGVILFLRLTWIVGVAGVGQAFLIVFICCSCTLLTAISMSAIATNGRVPAGGSYYMISRVLGPEFGGAVGVLFYLGTTFASSLYILGAVELLLTYIAPSMVIIKGEATEGDSVDLNNYRIYGTIILILLSLLVFVGVKYVNYSAMVFLGCVLLSIVAIFIGCFASPFRSGGTPFCRFNGTAIKQAGPYPCNFDEMNSLLEGNDSRSRPFTNPFYLDNDGLLKRQFNGSFEYVNGIPGLKGGVFTQNGGGSYMSSGDARPGIEASPSQAAQDITTTFTVLLAIFFPSVTGIMAGSNRSGDLKDAQLSIPKGTIGAILTTSLIYMATVLLFGANVDGVLLRDKFGDSIGGSLVVAELAWPSPWVILIGSFLSTVGAGLQSLTGAPRLLQAIARDNLIPLLSVFGVASKSGEPTRALLLTILLSEVGILIASLDKVAPIITMFFLMCYAFVNLACTLQSLLKAPNWRPRFRYYHWLASFSGMCLCLVLMFISSWYYALAAFVVAVVIYKYIEFRGAEKEWGDGIRGLSLQAARFALLRLEEGPPHTKNWRPQLLILSRLDSNLLPTDRNLLAFASQMKIGKGLSLVSSVLEGNFVELFGEVTAAKLSLKNAVRDEKMKAFCQVIAAPDVTQGMSYLVQGSGLGGMTHNTVMLAWPQSWKTKNTWKKFVQIIRTVSAAHHAMLVMKGHDQFPTNVDRVTGHIDIWWIVHDGGLLMLLPFLLRQHKVWRSCKLRIFTVAQMEDNSLQMRRDLESFLYQLRIEAEVEVVEMLDSDITAYTYERTLVMEERQRLVQDLNLSKKQKQLIPDRIVDDSHVPGAPHNPGPALDPNTRQPSVTSLQSLPAFQASPSSLQLPSPGLDNVRRMNTAVKLNEIIVHRSHKAQLVVVNLPGPPAPNTGGEESYMEFVDVMTEGLERVLLVRGGGREVITVFS